MFYRNHKRAVTSLVSAEKVLFTRLRTQCGAVYTEVPAGHVRRSTAYQRAQGKGSYPICDPIVLRTVYGHPPSSLPGIPSPGRCL